jgi:hypothetical protein
MQFMLIVEWDVYGDIEKRLFEAKDHEEALLKALGDQEGRPAEHFQKMCVHRAFPKKVSLFQIAEVDGVGKRWSNVHAAIKAGNDERRKVHKESQNEIENCKKIKEVDGEDRGK